MMNSWGTFCSKFAKVPFPPLPQTNMHAHTWHKILQYLAKFFSFDEILLKTSIVVVSGVAFLFMHLAKTLFKDEPTKKEEYLNKALEILEIGDHNLRGRRCTFLCGDAGKD